MDLPATFNFVCILMRNLLLNWFYKTKIESHCIAAILAVAVSFIRVPDFSVLREVREVRAHDVIEEEAFVEEVEELYGSLSHRGSGTSRVQQGDV